MFILGTAPFLYMKILALDQASVISGWAFFQSGKLKESGLVSVKKEKVPEARFYKMSKAIEELIDRFKPDWIVYEEVMLQTNVSTLHTLCQLQGAIKQMCFERNIESYVYAPSSWRKLLDFQQGKGIKREDLKLQAIELVDEMYNKSVSEDEADAICIGHAFQKLIAKGEKK